MTIVRTTLLATAAALGLLSVPAGAQSQTGGTSTSATTPAKDVAGTGTVRKVDAARRVVNLSHDPIPAIGWPQMTMDFAVDPKVDLSTVKAGQAVEFTLGPAGGGNYAITSIKPKG